MRKLLTPAQYEPSLEGLNEIRPLELKDETSLNIPYPVLCENLPNERRQGIGKFARCTKDGALVKHRGNDVKIYQIVQDSIDYPVTNMEFVFFQKVKYVLLDPIGILVFDLAWWTDSTHMINLGTVSYNKPTFILFRGTHLYLRVAYMGPWGHWVVDARGFY